jgi:ribonuclease III
MILSTIAEKLRISALFKRFSPAPQEPLQQDRQEMIRGLLARSPFEIAGVSDAALPLYDQALTHRSYAAVGRYPGPGNPEDNERLEFLGNYILDFIVAEHIYARYPLPPADMSRRLQVTGNASLADVVMRQDLGIDALIRRKGQALTDSIIADAFEALIAAIYLDQGQTKAQEVVLAIFADEIERQDTGRNYKGRLQELAAKKNLGQPDYEYRQAGPGDNPIWTARAMLAGTTWGEGRDRTKQGAAMHAAREALERLESPTTR